MSAEDRELLELAAKAAGVKDFTVCAETGAPFDALGYWNPLEDDGDAFRLECALQIGVSWGMAVVNADTGRGFHTAELIKDHNGDRAKARRLAVLRAAAEIGRRMA